MREKQEEEKDGGKGKVSGRVEDEGENSALAPK